MAFMTSHPAEGVMVEQKIQPVPSSDKMALDLEINGTTNRDEPTIDSSPPDLLALNKASETLPSTIDDATVNSNTLDVNGAANNVAFSANTIATIAIATNLADIALESQLIAETSPSATNYSLQLPDTNTTTTETQKFSASPEARLSEFAPILAPTELAIDAAIDSAMKDNAATSSVLPVIDAPESDLRNSSPSPPLRADVEASRPGLDLDFSFDGQPDSINEATSTALPVAAESDANVVSKQTPPGLPIHPLNEAPRPEASTNLRMTSPSLIKEEEQSRPEDTTMAVNDTEMEDAPPLPHPSKIAREREEEDDFDSQPSAKRTKTAEAEDQLSSISTGPPAQNGGAVARAPGSPMSPWLVKEIVKILKNVVRTRAGQQVRAPVLELWPGLIESYTALIPRPIDLGTMEKKLKAGEYPDFATFKDDCHLLARNASTFNGYDHDIAKQARDVQNSILDKVSNIGAEPAPIPKKEKVKKQSSESTSRAPVARRQSRGAGAGAPQSVPASMPFALDPSTSTPLIRRDSTKTDGGRPKREIHPPKNKDLPYSVRPKSKKYATELKFCEELLTEIKKVKHFALNQFFLEPVDPVALNIPHYFTIIKNPMDLSTVSKKVKEGAYTNAKEFEKDVKLMFINCYRFNPPDNAVHQAGKEFERFFDIKWSEKQQWIEDHTPTAASPSSPLPSEDEESEEDEEEEHIATTEALSTAAQRLTLEQDKLIALLSAKHRDNLNITIQQQVVDVIKKEVENEKRTKPAVKKANKVKASKPARKPTLAKKERTSGKKAPPKQTKVLGTVEKEVISAGLTSLPDEVAGTVLELIKRDKPGVDIGEDGTLELDIDSISAPALWTIYNLIMHHAPDIGRNIRSQYNSEREAPRAIAKPAPKKKNKPMSKADQERNIELLKNRVQEFERQASGSQEPVMPTVEKHEQAESSGDEDSDSEEE